MNNDTVLVDYYPGGIGMITLNRPDRHNAFDDKMILQLTAALLDFKKDNKIKIVILYASGKNFSAGADLDWMKKMIQYSEKENLADAMQLVELLKTLSNMEKITIALAKGITMGGGVGLLACCDIVIAEEAARFCFSETKLGLVPATIAPYVIQAIGPRLAKYYFLTAKIFTAVEARDIKLVHDICSQDVFSNGINLARSLLKNGPQSLLTIKKLVSRFNSVDDALLNETALIIAQVRTSAEAQEGLSAFLEKRDPEWAKSNGGESIK
ncbi:MAG: enoyl-CoA hydratase/isomerase family protein [Gammaproteobacteria bacterium]|nr:enoyl-CoA hydratase/isomerase family protein [Gammaproteobacteria bacterium]